MVLSLVSKVKTPLNFVLSVANWSFHDPDNRADRMRRVNTINNHHMF
jgi:hypothetical protein